MYNKILYIIQILKLFEAAEMTLTDGSLWQEKIKSD